MARKKTINRFNQDPNKSPFINDFQKIMINKLSKILTNKEIRCLVNAECSNTLSSINTNTKNLLLLTTEVEPQIYLLAQETAKKITGDYIPIEQLLHILLTCFIKTYQQEPFKIIPFKHVRKGARFKTLQKFQSRFAQFYDTHVESFNEI
jgi:hypothetical protein